MIPYQKTKQLLDQHYKVIAFDGGSHRFEHMDESLGEIYKLYFEWEVNDGFKLDE